MTNRTLTLDDALHRYLLDVSLRESPLLERLRAETAALPTANWQIAPEQGQFMALLVRLLGARRVLEVGTYTGYSALVMAEALPEGGLVVCLDRAGNYHTIARRYWREAGVDARIQLRTGEALTCLEALEQEGGEAFDLVFIDADKANYPRYLEHALRLVRRGGLVLFDNVLWSGRVLQAEPDSDDTRGIQALNRALRDDPRVEISLLPLGDGLTLCRKC
ncbi:O-methyltransferase [Metapseudomonas otitidis]|uniref:O-methyltransferase n=1 Tax=Metapseudomonas otitidis TaxID=319939 RepID=UPI0013F640FD|nr:class I SAM-dependent methyltransferase [Pseudomonas otitidis]